MANRYQFLVSGYVEVIADSLEDAKTLLTRQNMGDRDEAKFFTINENKIFVFAQVLRNQFLGEYPAE